MAARGVQVFLVLALVALVGSILSLWSREQGDTTLGAPWLWILFIVGFSFAVLWSLLLLWTLKRSDGDLTDQSE